MLRIFLIDKFGVDASKQIRGGFDHVHLWYDMQSTLCLWTQRLPASTVYIQ